MKKALILLLILLILILPACKPKEETPGRINIQKEVIPGTRTFKETGDPICVENNKPLIAEFSTTWCPHCKWIKETFQETVKEYEGEIAAYQWDIDINDNALTEEKESNVPLEHMAVYQNYNPKGSIPTFVFGCKYLRIGNGYESQDNLAAEKQEFKEIIEELIKESKELTEE